MLLNPDTAILQGFIVWIPVLGVEGDLGFLFLLNVEVSRICRVVYGESPLHRLLDCLRRRRHGDL